MLVALHKNARITPAARVELAVSHEELARVLAQCFGIIEADGL